MFEKIHIKRMKLAIEESGSLKEKIREIYKALDVLSRKISHIKQTIPHIVEHFRNTHDMWFPDESRVVIGRPFHIPPHLEIARRYGIYAFVLFVIEALVGGLVLNTRFGISFLWGLVAAAGGAVAGEAVVTVLLEKYNHPLTTVRHLRHFVVIPMAIVMTISLAILAVVFRGGVDAEDALAMHNLFNNSLYVMSGSLLFLLGGIVGLRSVFLWSHRDTKRYDKLDQDLHVFEVLHHDLTRQLDHLSKQSQVKAIHHDEVHHSQEQIHEHGKDVSIKHVDEQIEVNQELVHNHEVRNIPELDVGHHAKPYMEVLGNHEDEHHGGHHA